MVTLHILCQHPYKEIVKQFLAGKHIGGGRPPFTVGHIFLFEILRCKNIGAHEFSTGSPRLELTRKPEAEGRKGGTNLL
jgi:hypothetical protein